VQKSRDPHDGRALRLSLTAGGLRQAAEAVSSLRFMAEALEGLSLNEQALLLRTLSKLIRQLQQDARIPPQRMCVSCRFFKPNLHDDVVNPHRCAYFDYPFGDRQLKLDCAQHETATSELARDNWFEFTRYSGPGFPD